MGCDSQCLENVYLGILISSSVFSLVAIVISLCHIRQHLHYLSQTNIQYKIIPIIFMVVIYALFSTIALATPVSSFSLQAHRRYLQFPRDAYEACLIYAFFALLILYIGVEGDSIYLDRVYRCLQRKEEINQLCPFNLCIRSYKIPNTVAARKFIVLCKACVVQFIPIKIIITLIVLIWEVGSNNLQETEAYIWIINFLSASISLYFLILFYFATRQELLPYNPMPKFILVKMMLFFTFWQAVMLLILERCGVFDGFQLEGSRFDNYPEVASLFQNGLICFEMFVLSILMLWAFPVDKSMMSKKVWASKLNLISSLIESNFNDTINDLSEVGDGIKDQPKVVYHHPKYDPATRDEYLKRFRKKTYKYERFEVEREEDKKLTDQ